VIGTNGEKLEGKLEGDSWICWKYTGKTDREKWDSRLRGDGVFCCAFFNLPRSLAQPRSEIPSVSPLQKGGLALAFRLF